MKYGILGDIHGNIEALEAVLEAMEKEGCRKYISVGDLVGYGASPHECIKRVRDLNTVVVAGNHDLAAIDRLNIDFFNTFAKESAIWTRNTLTEEEKEFIAGLKLVEHVDNFTVVHSTLYSPELFEYIQTSYDAHISFELQERPLVFVGHSHIPVNFIRRRTVSFNMDPQVKVDPACKTMVNVGSIGQPRDENPAAVCAIYDSVEQIVRISRVKYDIAGAMKRIVDAGLPDILAERLKFGR
ncbi:MAG: hypothetical protein A2Z34_00865 [Planctomycetes bacterium RBG_16_59_8]|nr:MAG: hypothetical protein A2Z34_00865 [Planctomycetes bacterium RBG_16_59_8]